VLVGEQGQRADKNPNARYVAQRTQLGSGSSNTNRTQIPKSSLVALDRPGVVGGEGMAARQSAQESGDDELIATRAPAVKVLYFAAAAADKDASRMPELLEKRPDLKMASNDDGVELHMRGEARNQLWVAADTRESDVAVYLDSWRRKVERVGTMNFPDVARRKKHSGTPVIEVTIGADGKLLATTIRRSSGHPDIDEAAMRILKLAAPYDPFPHELNVKHDEIRIAYEWQFLGGLAQESTVYYADPAAREPPP
jgi:periplasmic protein TonB